MKAKIANSSFFKLFHFQDDFATGRTILLFYNSIASIANVFITGALQTAFLTENNIDIVRAGIITFIPYISWLVSIFSPRVLQRFKRRRPLLLFNHIFYYSCVILATTVTPMFVRDSSACTAWFALFLLLGNLSNALLGPGVTAWHMRFIPEGEDRNVYFSFTNIVNNISGVVTMVIASLVTDAIAGSMYRGRVILGLRFFAFALFICFGLMLYLIPKEFPYALSTQKYRLRDMFLRPIRERKFILTVLIAFLWNLFCNLNAGTWTYYILNTVGMSYITTTVGSVTVVICGFFLFGFWRKMIRRHSLEKVMMFCVTLSGIMEFIYALTTPGTIWIFVMVSIASGMNTVGIQLVFADLFYMNLPKKDTDLFSTFWNFSVNICVLCGSVFGTWLLSLMEKETGPCFQLADFPFYGSQLLCCVKGVCFLGMVVYIRKVSSVIHPESS